MPRRLVVRPDGRAPRGSRPSWSCDDTLGPGAEGLQGLVNLDTHIDDVLGTAADANDDRLVLVGHSYGGTLISGAAHRIADRWPP